MKKILIILLLLTTSYSAHSESDFKVDITNLDTNKYCVYGKSVYSIGSTIEMPQSIRECIYYAHTTNNTPPGARWAKN